MGVFRCVACRCLLRHWRAHTQTIHPANNVHARLEILDAIAAAFNARYAPIASHGPWSPASAHANKATVAKPESKLGAEQEDTDEPEDDGVPRSLLAAAAFAPSLDCCVKYAPMGVGEVRACVLGAQHDYVALNVCCGGVPRLVCACCTCLQQPSKSRQMACNQSVVFPSDMSVSKRRFRHRALAPFDRWTRESSCVATCV